MTASESMTPRPKPNALVWLLLSVVIIGLDQWTTTTWLASRARRIAARACATGRSGG